MITPESIVPESGEFIFVANHGLQSEEAVARSVAFHRGRIAHARKHLSPVFSRCVITYDLRGQAVPEAFQEKVRADLSDLSEVRFLS